MGVTDIDDKIINRSNEAKINFKSLAKKYEAEFFKDLEHLNVLGPTMTVRVSDHIPEIVSFVNTLVKKSCAYQANSGNSQVLKFKYKNYYNINFNTVRPIIIQKKTFYFSSTIFILF